MRILVVRYGAFGDIIHTLPMAADLAAAGHRIDWVCEDRWSALLNASPIVDRVHRLPRKRINDKNLDWWERWRALRDLVRSVRAGMYDLVIDAQGLAKSAGLAQAVGAPCLLGHGRPRSREASWLAYARRIPADAEHVIDQNRGLATAVLGRVEGPWRFPLPAWTAERAWATAWLAERGLGRPWMLNVGAGWPTKVWPQERQVGLARHLAEARIPLVVVWGSPAERRVAETVVEAVPSAVLAPDTDLPRLAGLLAGAGMVVSGDTGPLHLALAVGVPAVGLFGPVPARRNGPRGNGYRCLQAPGAAWERRDLSKVDMGAISVEAVWQAAMAALAERGCTPGQA